MIMTAILGKRALMKTIFRTFFAFTFIAALPARAHSTCQYLHSEAQCHENPRCVWMPYANDSGQCLYEKDAPKAATLCAAAPCITAALPDWVPLATKSAAIDQFVEWAQPGPLYRITKIQGKPLKFDSGQDGWEVTILLSDSKECADRNYFAQCTPMSQHGSLFCLMFMTDCIGQIQRQLTRVIE
jgi:hypothetical protein